MGIEFNRPQEPKNTNKSNEVHGEPLASPESGKDLPKRRSAGERILRVLESIVPIQEDAEGNKYLLHSRGVGGRFYLGNKNEESDS